MQTGILPNGHPSDHDKLTILVAVPQLTYLPQAVLSQLTVTHLASFPSSTQSLPGPLKGMSSMKLAGLVQLFSWLSQFIGHGAAEGRAPALLDNLLQGA